jgi:hypothetical protein
MLTSCGTSKVVLTQGGWHFDTTHVRASNPQKDMFFKLSVDNKKPFPNFTSDTLDSHYFVDAKNWDTYKYKKYMADVIRAVPFKIDSLCFILANNIMEVKLGWQKKKWTPDIEAWKNIDNDKYIKMGKTFYSRPTTSYFPERGVYWRNLLKSNRKKRILAVDRMCLKGTNYAIIYILQTEKKHLGYCFFFDITEFGCIQHIASVLNNYNEITEQIVDAYR